MALETTKFDRKYGELLRAINAINDEDLARAFAYQEQKGLPLDEVLVENGILSMQDLHQALADHLGIDTIDVAHTDIDTTVLREVPVKLVHRYGVIPIDRLNGTMRIAISDPLNFHAIDDLRMMLKCEIEPVLGYSKDIRAAIKRHYGIGADTIDSMMEDEEINLEQVDADRDVDELSEDANIIRFVNQILNEAVSDRATDIHIEPFEEQLRIRYRIDGLLYESPVPASIRRFQAAVISRIKIMADMNIAEKRLPQDGRINIRSGGTEYDLRVSTVPTPYGESIVIRILNRSGEMYDLDVLGMDNKHYESFKEMIGHPHGVILVTGPTGSGKTTTLYAALAELNKPDVKIITIEDPIEYQMEGITQIQVQSSIGLTFASILRSLLRQDPDIMLVGETRDQETAEITIRTALTGHLVFTTLHTNDAAGAVARLLDMDVEPFLISSSLLGIIAQRLVRRICPACKEAYEPPRKTLLGLGLDPDAYSDVGYYHGRGCEACKFLGYKGRTGIYEMIPMTEEIREMVARRVPSNEIKKIALLNGMMTLRQYGWQQVLKGLTSPEEVLRVTQSDALAGPLPKSLDEMEKMVAAGEHVILEDKPHGLSEPSLPTVTKDTLTQVH